MAPEKEFVYYLLKKIDKESINISQYQHLKQKWDLNPSKCLEIITPYFSNQSLQTTRKIFNNNDGFSLLQKSITLFKCDLHKKLKMKALRDDTTLKDMVLPLLEKLIR